MTDKTSSSIDAVVTWVDGNDPAHAARLTSELGRRQNLSLKRIPGGHGRGRYIDNNEIEYCIHGIRKFMPWIRNIYLVTDRQTPTFLDAEYQLALGVTILDHEHVFRGYEWALPTFNSISIETVLHRVRGLAEKYIYLNDDVIPIAPSLPSDFFVDDKVVIRGQWEPYSAFGKGKTLASAIALKILSKISRRSRSPHLLAQMRAARLAGFQDMYFHAAHAPHPVRTETLGAFFRDHEELLRENIRHRFRHLDQFVAHPLAHHLEAGRGTAVECDGSDCLTISFDKPSELDAQVSRLEDPKLKFVCVQGLELADEALATRVHEFLARRTTGSSVRRRTENATQPRPT